MGVVGRRRPIRLLGRIRIARLRVGILRLRRVARHWLILRLRLVLLLRVGAVGRLLLLLVVGGHGRVVGLLGLAPGVHLGCVAAASRALYFFRSGAARCFVRRRASRGGAAHALRRSAAATRKRCANRRRAETADRSPAKRRVTSQALLDVYGQCANVPARPARAHRPRKSQVCEG